MKQPYIYISAILLAIGLGYVLRGCTIKTDLGDIKDSIDANNIRVAVIDGQKQRDSIQLAELTDSLAKQEQVSVALRKQLATVRTKVITIRPIVDCTDVHDFLVHFGRRNM